MSFLDRMFGSSRPSNRIGGSAARGLVANGALLLDVRTAAEFKSGHIEGAVNIPVDSLARRLDEVPAERSIVVYCRSGNRSQRAIHVLEHAGRGPVHDLGSINAW